MNLPSNSLVLVAIVLFLSGCNAGKFSVKPAIGKVLCNGKPVSSGSVSFTPIGTPGSIESGKQASGAISPDGTFKLSTYGRFDGAIVGKHSVQYTGGDEDSESAEVDESDSDETTRTRESKRSGNNQPGAQCIQKGEIIVEVKASGQNEFTIELNSPGT